MASKQLETAIRDKIRLSSGKQFQQMFWDIMVLRCLDFQTPRMMHDKGNDGYSIMEKNFFSCYATEEIKYDNDGTVKKMTDDYESFCKNWISKNYFEKWVFVTKENLMGKPHQKIVDLNMLADGVAKENWGMEQVVREILCLEIKDIVRILDLDDFYLEGSVNEEKDFGVIGEIFEHMYSKKINAPNIDSIKKSDNFISLIEKIPLNFSGEGLETAKEMIIRNWEHKVVVEKYVEEESRINPSRVESLIDMVQSDFRVVRESDHHGVAIESVRVIEALAKKYLPIEKQSNPDYVAGSRAVVLYLFEMCYLGKKTDDELAANIKLF